MGGLYSSPSAASPPIHSALLSVIPDMMEIRAHHTEGEERFRKPLYRAPRLTTHRLNPPHLLCPLLSHPVGCRGRWGVCGEPTYICAAAAAAAGTADECGQWLLLPHFLHFPHPSLALPPSKHNGTDCPCDTHSHTEGALLWRLSAPLSPPPHRHRIAPHPHWNVAVFPRQREERAVGGERRTRETYG